MSPTPEPPVEEAKPSKEPTPDFNAKAYLEKSLPRNPGDFLKVYPMHRRGSFRVNWYGRQASPEAAIPGLNIAYIRESKFLFCRLNAEGMPEITYPAKQ